MIGLPSPATAGFSRSASVLRREESRSGFPAPRLGSQAGKPDLRTVLCCRVNEVGSILYVRLSILEGVPSRCNSFPFDASPRRRSPHRCKYSRRGPNPPSHANLPRRRNARRRGSRPRMHRSAGGSRVGRGTESLSQFCRSQTPRFCHRPSERVITQSEISAVPQLSLVLVLLGACGFIVGLRPSRHDQPTRLPAILMLYTPHVGLAVYIMFSDDWMAQLREWDSSIRGRFLIPRCVSFSHRRSPVGPSPPHSDPPPRPC